MPIGPDRTGDPNQCSQRHIPHLGKGWYGVTNYWMNSGTSNEANSGVSDGIYNSGENTKRSLTVITDGTSQTIFMGEKNLFDPNMLLFCTIGSPWYSGATDYARKQPGWYSAIWLGSGGQFVPATAGIQINFQITPAIAQAASTDNNVFTQYWENRMHAYGSNHAGGGRTSSSVMAPSASSETVSLCRLCKDFRPAAPATSFRRTFNV